MIKIEIIQIPKYSSENFFLTYSAVSPKLRTIFHSDGTKARVTNCTSDQLKEIHELMTFARKHRAHKLNASGIDDDQN